VKAKSLKNVLLAASATALAWLALAARRGNKGQRAIPERDSLSQRPMPATGNGTAGGQARGSAAVTGGWAPDRLQRRRLLAAGLIGALGVTVVSAIFIVAFIGGLHDPGPRSVPIGLVGSHAQASKLRSSLHHQASGDFTVGRYKTEAGARNAIDGRVIDAALVPGTSVQHLLVASAVSASETSAIIKTFSAGASHAHVHLTVQNIRPLHSSDPDGLSMSFFVIALLAPSLVVGNLLIGKIGPRLNMFWHMGMIAIYAVTVAAVATAIADAGIGALTGAPWAIFGVGALLAFAAALTGAAAQRWAGGLGYLVLLLLFVPVGISSSGTTLGPRMITPWYADLGRALPPGAAEETVRNVTYFSGNAITNPLLILSAWALAGFLALHPPMPGRHQPNPDAAVGTTAAPASLHDTSVKV
jgi:MFS family permease